MYQISCLYKAVGRSKNPGMAIAMLIFFFKIFFFQAQDKSICELKCSEEPTEYVCGDDNLNYRNQCELRQASLCDGKNVKKLHRGKCSDAESAGKKLF